MFESVLHYPSLSKILSLAHHVVHMVILQCSVSLYKFSFLDLNALEFLTKFIFDFILTCQLAVCHTFRLYQMFIIVLELCIDWYKVSKCI
jgi:hypothetical protein